jgi:hypothetical protein
LENYLSSFPFVINAHLLLTAAGAAAGLVDVAANGGTASQSSTHYDLWGCGYNGLCSFF